MIETSYKMNDGRDNTSRKLHLTKDERMPRCYKDAEKIIKSVQSCQNNFKTAMANSRFRGAHFKKVYSLSLNVLKHYNYIQKIIDKTEMLTRETFLRREIASVLIYELIYGKGYLPGGSKVVTIVQAYENDILKMHEELQNSTDACELNGIYIPRYVRVHTLKTTVAYVIKDLKMYGFRQILYEENISEEKYLELVRSLKKGDFFVDFHFKDILVFAQDENLIELDLYKNGHIFLQDKASYIPVHALNPEPGSTVLDACAAPGMKSAHIASKMENKGTLIACERDAKRFEILKETLEYGSVKIVKTLCTDFKLIDPNDEAYASVEYILLDPSCSGSGMVNRMDEVTNNENSTSKERIQKLAGFQIILLKHALKFPSVKRVVYSTCSIHEEENEYVVHEALGAFGNSFKLVPVLPEWFFRGSGSYQYSEMCLRTDPTKHLTNGFFVAVFERLQSSDYEDKYSKKYERFKSSGDDSEKVYTHDRKTKKSNRSVKEEGESSGLRELNENIENAMSDGKGKLERCIKNEENCEYRELNETVKDSLNDEDECKEKDNHSSNYEEANIENIIKSKSHKKKSKKSKYTEHTNIEMDKKQEMDSHYYKAGKQSNDFSDSFPEDGSTNIVQSPSTFQMSSEFDNIVLVKKKSKHKKSSRSEDKFDVTEESCELITEHKRKKKKRKYSDMSSSDTVPLEQQNECVSKSSDNLNKYNIENSININAGEDESCDLITEHKQKKKKKKKYSDMFSSDTIPLEQQQKEGVLEVFQVSKSNEKLNKYNIENTINFNAGEDESCKLITEHKQKKKKKKKYSDMSSSDTIPLEEQQNEDVLEVFQVSKSSDNLKKYNIDNTIKFNAGVDESCELITEHKRKKKKKRKYSDISSSDIIPLEEQQNEGVFGVFQVSKSSDNLNKYNIENTINLNAGEETLPKKHKKKKKKKESEIEES